jgi:hypothetical protein
MEGKVQLAHLLERRAPNAFEPEATDALLSHSGGVARDLLALAQSACVQAYLDGDDLIGHSHAKVAIDTFGRKHLQGLRPGELEVLERIRTGGAFAPATEDELALLMTRRVLEYRDENQTPRYAVHPTIAGFLAKSVASNGT